ncbi:MAG: Gentisate 1,2-dioxygenase (EC [uncultured Paraburkholderia sp.]|uniref:gentisate 1,2-dioxygenase n=1 Tax=uncultured Paraburkholderia sp. TaxID=1822466 RepID=UPI0025923492|nr:gentisate 1,2-dioxygenase [uncultured Paraburkholderia sp.]CAH2902190.1 MAG: Gentisate 1,2-dioxygenase (EC [uncultured Paraburkholderia sp.]CAH2936327.1 MAG: Gentisate 1,2-dioxygenase (EC [uncultured Paraburkholderia sp.]
MRDAKRSLEERRNYYAMIDKDNMTPLWEVLHALVPPNPRPNVVPTMWDYSELRSTLLQSGELISAEEAERRVLILENPGVRGQSRITQSLYAGLQLILPGEVAPAHRHSQSALRLVLDGEGAYTAVDGERTAMSRGDFITTPSMTWHDHGNLGDEPVVWLDGLDIPIVQFLDAGFAEKAVSSSQDELRQEGDALLRYGHNMIPIDFYQAPSDPTRVFVYPFSETRKVLRELADTPADPWHGNAFRFVNPATGTSPMPTIGAFARLLRCNSETRPYRSTDSAVFVCLEGEGTAHIGDQQFDFAENDVLVVPSWTAHQFRVPQNTILFSFSDRPVQQALGLWRDEKLS